MVDTRHGCIGSWGYLERQVHQSPFTVSKNTDPPPPQQINRAWCAVQSQLCRAGLGALFDTSFDELQNWESRIMLYLVGVVAKHTR